MQAYKNIVYYIYVYQTYFHCLFQFEYFILVLNAIIIIKLLCRILHFNFWAWHPHSLYALHIPNSVADYSETKYYIKYAREVYLPIRAAGGGGLASGSAAAGIVFV